MIFNDSKFNNNWNIKSLDELGKFNRGKSKHRPRNDQALFNDGKYPLIQTGEIREANLYINKHTDTYNDFGLAQSKLWPKETLCITIAANIAETALLGYPMCFPDSVVGFNADTNESSEIFMHYIFTYIKKSIQNAASGSIQDNINIDYLTGLKFRIPSKPYQDQIVDVLSSIDQKIDINNQINQELESVAKTIYDYWFVQFDFPAKDGKPYRANGGKMIWNDSLKREIPEAWTVGSLLDIAEYYNGLPCQKYRPIDENVLKVIKIKEMHEGFSDDTELVRSSIPVSAIIENGDLLFSWSASLDLKIWSGGKGALNQHIFKVTSNKYPFSFYYNQLINYLHHFKMMAEIRKTTMGHITLEHLEQSRIVLPPSDELPSKLDQILSPIYKKMINNNIQVENLKKIRDWLLPMLINGQVKINA